LGLPKIVKDYFTAHPKKTSPTEIQNMKKPKRMHAKKKKKDD